MKLATLNDGTPDGRLVLVSPDGCHYAEAPFATMQHAIERWDEAVPALSALNPRETLEGHTIAAPLPRAWQWLDGSAFPHHGELMQQAFGLPPIETDKPLMYQGMSHQFLGPCDDVALPSEADGIDFEGEFGIITDAVPMGVSADAAMGHVKLIVQINDWSLRAIAPIEMKTGFGWVQAKPACSLAPFAVTPDELGRAWHHARVGLDLTVSLNGQRFGNPNGAAMAFGFHELIAHAARTRSLPAGTIIGSGTVSNDNHGRVGSCCISERRAIEMIETGAPATGFMRFGDTVRMEALTADGRAPFGIIEQRIVQAR